MDEQQVVVQPKKKVNKTCRMCYNCRVRLAVNLNNILSTVITPANRREGLVTIYCRKGWWGEKANTAPLQFNINIVNKLEVVCPYFEGEDDEEDNSAFLL